MKTDSTNRLTVTITLTATETDLLIACLNNSIKYYDSLEGKPCAAITDWAKKVVDTLNSELENYE